MSKPSHCMRGKGFYVGYGLMSTDLNDKKGAVNYHYYITNEISSLPKRASKEHRNKLKKYAERAL